MSNSGAHPALGQGDRPPFAYAPVATLATIVAAGLLALAGRYGPHRDELYFVAAGHHPQWGYADQPSLTPLIAGAADSLAPGNLYLLRLVSAVTAAAVIVVSALIARELGGSAAAQLLTAVTVGSGVVLLLIGHLLSTTTLDVLCWTTVLLFALRALGRQEPRWWLAAGVVAGIGLENKQLIAFLLAGLAIGVLLTPTARPQLRSPWLWAGLLVAVVLGVPTVIWQSSHGWPQLEVSADINEEYRVPAERVYYVVQQLVLFSPLAAVVWLRGLWLLLRAERWTWARPLPIAYVVLFVAFAFTGGKGYYVAGILPALIAAGCVDIAERLQGRRLVGRGLLLALVAAVGWPIALPLLPATAFASSIYAVPGEDQLETIGWPAYARTLDTVLSRLPPDERATAVIFTQNYGEAGAAQYYDVNAPVYSGHNSWGDWGPPAEDAGPVVVVGFDNPTSFFQGCSQTATIDTGDDIGNEEDGRPIWLCAGPIGGWRQAWPRLEHLDG